MLGSLAGEIRVVEIELKQASASFERAWEGSCIERSQYID
jgi:hypothetical protein